MVSKTQIYMNEDSIDWTARFSDSEERSIFGILRDAKIQGFNIVMLDNALQQVEFDHYDVADLLELNVIVTIKINGEIEKRNYDFIKTPTGWGVVREFRGHALPVDITVNTTETTNRGHLTLDLQGTGAGNDTATLVIAAHSKTAS